MSAFDKARSVEAEGLHLLKPFLRETAHEGRFTLFSKGPMVRHLQLAGDLTFNSDEETAWTVEVKVEKHKTGNFFLESWSNKNLDNRRSHLERGSTPGWLQTISSDMLWYYFIDADELYIFNSFRLKQWAFGEGGRPGRVYTFPEKCQSKYVQPNDTHGWLVPINVLLDEMARRWPDKRPKLVYPRQIELFPAGEVAA